VAGFVLQLFGLSALILSVLVETSGNTHERKGAKESIYAA
jgi:hypothetical protein